MLNLSCFPVPLERDTSCLSVAKLDKNYQIAKYKFTKSGF